MYAELRPSLFAAAVGDSLRQAEEQEIRMNLRREYGGKTAPCEQEAANQRMTDTLGARFSGDGGGRKEANAGRDPYNRRSFILETASLMHRRGWIGLSATVGAGSVDVSAYPWSPRLTPGVG